MAKANTGFRRKWIAVVCLTTVCLLLPPSQRAEVQARPAYKGAFEKLYPKVKNSSKVTCAACHPGKSKKNRNHYGEALAKALKEKNVKDKKTITEALKKIEDGECGGNEWKARLEKGELPCEHDAVNRRLRPTLCLIQRLIDER
ncbi:MAG: hypothetical protein ACYTGL_30160 [Planctomycetota bacterium]|jgi:hypothetical protein